MPSHISENIDATVNAIGRAELTEASQADFERLIMMKKQQAMEEENGTRVSMRKKRKMTKKERMMEKEKRRERKRQMREKKRLMKQRQKDQNRKLEKVDCMITQWTEWEDCTQSCGKQYITRTRMIKRQPENGGKKCPKKLSRRRKCKLPKCRKYTGQSSDCMYTRVLIKIKHFTFYFRYKIFYYNNSF